MRNLITFILLLVFATSLAFSVSLSEISNYKFPSNGKKNVFILISDRILSFEMVRDGIEEGLREDYNIYSFNLESDRNVLNQIPSLVVSMKPDIVIAIGSLAFESLIGKVGDIPLVFGMVIDYKKFGPEKYENITGVSLIIPLEAIFFNFKLILPNVSKVGLICSKEYFDTFVLPEVSSLKTSTGIELVPEYINSSSEFQSAYSRLKGKINALWMVPDTKTLSKDAIQFFLSSTYKDKIPNIVFSENFVVAGGFFSVSPSYPSIGSQIAIILRKIIEDNKSPSSIGIVPPVGTYTAINKKLVSEFKLNINEFVLGNVDKVIE